MLDKNRLGFAIGSLAALLHAVWAFLVWLGVAQSLVDALLSLHFISLSYDVNDFEFGKAVLLVIATFIFGYVIGWVVGAIWNSAKK